MNDGTFIIYKMVSVIWGT